MKGPHLRFIELHVPPGTGTTKRFQVDSTHAEAGTAALGWLYWHKPWRRYIFHPQPGTIYDRDCMLEICEFLKKLMDEHVPKPRKRLLDSGTIPMV